MLFSCGNSQKEIADITFEEGFPDEVTEQATIFYSDSARVKVKLKAPVIERYHKDEEKSVFSEGIDVEFYDKLGAVDSRITSNWAVQYEDKGIMEARNDVVVVNRKGEKLNTELLVWNRKKAEITSDAFVKITTAEEIIYGDGLRANEDFTQYEVQHIKGIIEVEEELEDQKSNEDVP
jgi:LPS export ABC transporter protein LptC